MVHAPVRSTREAGRRGAKGRVFQKTCCDDAEFFSGVNGVSRLVRSEASVSRDRVVLAQRLQRRGDEV